jgi:hypothetical protein
MLIAGMRKRKTQGDMVNKFPMEAYPPSSILKLPGKSHKKTLLIRRYTIITK